MSGQLAGRRIALTLATSTGGVGAHVRALIGPLAATGAQVSVHGPAATEELFGFRAAGGRFVAVEIATRPHPARDAWAVARLAWLTRHSDVVHAHGLRAGSVAALAGIMRSRPTVVTVHNALLDPPGLRRRILALLEALVCRRADIVLGASEDLVAGALRAGARDARMAPVAAPSLPGARRSPDEVRAELGAADRPLIVAVGRLHEQKGYDVLIQAAARWKSLEPVPLVAVAGSGPLESQLRSQIAELRAPVRLLGRRSDVADLLQAAALVVLPSRWEARSLVAQEAMRAGRPLVTTAVGGLPHLVGGGAELVAPGDVDALDAAVRRLLGDPAAAEALGQGAAARAMSFPSEGDTAQQVIAVYAELLGAAQS